MYIAPCKGGLTLTETYIPLDSAATFEGLSYRAMLMRIHRDENIKTKKEMNPNGGKEKILVSLSALSSQAKRKYKAQLAANSKMSAEHSIGTDRNMKNISLKLLK